MFTPLSPQFGATLKHRYHNRDQEADIRYIMTHQMRYALGRDMDNLTQVNKYKRNADGGGHVTVNITEMCERTPNEIEHIEDSPKVRHAIGWLRNQLDRLQAKPKTSKAEASRPLPNRNFSSI